VPVTHYQYLYETLWRVAVARATPGAALTAAVALGNGRLALRADAEESGALEALERPDDCRTTIPVPACRGARKAPAMCRVVTGCGELAVGRTGRCERHQHTVRRLSVPAGGRP
jgi:hypothetical protein